MVWAAAIYDCSNGKLILTRDRLPPITHQRIKFLLCFELSFSKKIEENEEVIYHYLRYSITDYDKNTLKASN